jgi:transposase
MHYVGIDWAEAAHQVCLMTADGRVLSEFVITHDGRGFERLRTALDELGPVEINLERSDGVLVDWLVAQGWTIFVTAPRILASHRPRRSKDDRGDAHLLAELRRRNDPDTHPLVVHSQLVEELRCLLRAYDQLHKQQVKTGNQLRQVLIEYYLGAVRAFSSISGPVTLAFLSAYPNPETAQAASYEELAAFLRRHGYTCTQHFDKLYQRLQTSEPQARVEVGHIAHMLALVEVLKTLHHQLGQVTRQLQRTFAAHPEADWWRAFPGAGPLTAPRLLAQIGDNPAAFPSFQTLQATAGTVPITRQSGQKRVVKFRWACSHPLRKAAMDLARNSVRESGWARSYFNRQRALGHNTSRAYRALANRWLRIIWTVRQRGEIYDETRHIANRSRQGRIASAHATTSQDEDTVQAGALEVVSG